MTVHYAEALGVTTRTARASELPPVAGMKSDLVLNLCRQCRATEYLSGARGRDYLDEGSFRAAGIDVHYQDYAHPIYRQVYPGFVPNMGIIDLMMNEEAPQRLMLGEPKADEHR